MALALFDRVQETTTTTGTGSVTLGGAVPGFQTFAVVGNGNTCYYTIVDGSAWEVGVGTYSTSGPTLARTTILSNSNGNVSPITLTAGVKSIFLTYPAGKSVNLNESGNVSPLGTVSSGVWQGSTVGVAYGGTGVTASSGANSVVLRDSDQNIAVNRVNQLNTNTTAAGGTTVLTAASSYIHTLVGTGGQTYTLPDATTLTTGVAFVFNNLATGTLTLANYAGTTIGTIPSGGAGAGFLTLNSTVGGTWDLHAYLPEGVTFGTNAFNLGTSIISGGTWQGGTIQTGYGGTGLTSYTSGGAVYANSSSTLTSGTLPLTAGGTAATSAAGARTSLDVPSTTGSGASGTWGINISGNAATATNATTVTSITSGQVTTALGYTPNAITFSRFAGDLNTLGVSNATSGVYNIGAGYTNGPGNTSLYGTLQAYWNGDIATQFWFSYNGDAYWRKSIGATYAGSTWRTILDSSTYNSYAPTLTGGGASGTWGISITGSASGSSGSVANAATFNSGGAGDASGTTFNGSAARTISYNTLGAPSTTGTNASGTWGISVSGNSATTSQRAFSGDISTTGQGRFTGWYSGGASTTLATEIGVSGGQSYILSYNRDTSAYGVLNISGSACNLQISGSTVNVSSGALQQGGSQVLTAGNYTSYAPSTTGSGASGTWGIRITGFANAGTPRLYASDSPYNYDGAAPYYMAMTYDGSRWLLQVTPGTPAAVRVAYADTAGSAGSVDFANLTNKAGGTGTYTTSGDYRAPIFYDSGNTAYYVDPAGTSNLGRAQLNNGTGTALYISTIVADTTTRDAIELFENSGQATGRQAISWFNGGQGYYKARMWTEVGGSYAATQFGIDVADNARTVATRFYIYNADVYANSSFRAPIFYDSNNTAYYVDPASTSLLNAINVYGGGLYDSQTGFRLTLPGGAAYVTSASVVSGAIKVRLPPASLASNTMLGFDVDVYTYDGQSFTIRCGGYNYSDAGKSWINTFAYMLSGNRAALNVRFGWDGTSQCIWIGELGSSWSYPQVGVSNFVGGYSAYTAANFASGWTVSFEASSFYSVSSSWTVYPFPYYSGQSATLYSSDSMRSPIFYDLNNTAYYLDAASTSRINSINYDNLYFASDTTYGLIGRNGYLDTLNGRGSDPLELCYYDGGPVKIGSGTNGSKALYASEVYSTIFYDSNNTSYYLDPASTTSLRTVGSWRADSASWDGEFNGKIQYHSSNWYFQYAGSMLFRNSGGSNVFTVDQSGNAVASGNVTAYSDARIKENVVTIDDALDKVLRLRGVYYNKIGNPERRVGVIAQETEPVLPEVVRSVSDTNPSTGETTELLAVDYGNITGLLIEAMKEQNQEVVDLRNRVAQLESLIHKLIGD